MKKVTNVWDRLLEVFEADNLDQVAEKLGINSSTLRGRKARGALPYNEIVQIMDAKQLAYVLKNKHVENLTAVDDIESPFLAGQYQKLFSEGNNSRSEKINPGTVKSEFEHFLMSLMQRIENAPFSKQAKIQIIDTLICIVEKDLDEVRQEYSFGC